MKNNTMFNYNLLFGDYMAKVSDQAKLYYIKLNFYANNGFVPNPLSVLDSMGYDKSVFKELVDAGELLVNPNRAEVFITSYFVHNHLDTSSWTHTIFYPYWKGMFWIKRNGVASMKPKPADEEPKVEEPKNDLDGLSDKEVDELLKSFEH